MTEATEKQRLKLAKITITVWVPGEYGEDECESVMDALEDVDLKATIESRIGGYLTPPRAAIRPARRKGMLRNKPFEKSLTVGEALEAVKNQIGWAEYIREGEFNGQEAGRIMRAADSLRRALVASNRRIIDEANAA